MNSKPTAVCAPPSNDHARCCGFGADGTPCGCACHAADTTRSERERESRTFIESLAKHFDGCNCDICAVVRLLRVALREAELYRVALLAALAFVMPEMSRGPAIPEWVRLMRLLDASNVLPDEARAHPAVAMVLCARADAQEPQRKDDGLATALEVK